MRSQLKNVRTEVGGNATETLYCTASVVASKE